MMNRIGLAGAARRMLGRFFSPVEVAVALNGYQLWHEWSGGHMSWTALIVRAATLLGALGAKALILRVESVIVALAAEIVKQNKKGATSLTVEP